MENLVKEDAHPRPGTRRAGEDEVARDFSEAKLAMQIDRRAVFDISKVVRAAGALDEPGEAVSCGRQTDAESTMRGIDDDARKIPAYRRGVAGGLGR